MAYNPFDFFRRNQKILFAVLTVFIMIMFTLSWGANDFFQWFPRWLGTRSSGEVMAVVDGTKVRTSDLDEIMRHRRTANEFMIAAARNTNARLTAELTKLTPTVSEANRGTVSEFAALRRTGYIPEQFVRLLENPQMRQFILPMQDENIARLRQSLAKMAAANNPKPDDLEAARVAQSLLAFDLNPPRGGLYFADAPNDDRKDAMDFLLWRKKADQLGVRFTPEDVDQLVELEFPRFDKEQRAAAMAAVADDRRGVNPAEVLAHLAEEFRVRAAQQAVLGAAFVRAAAPAPASPDQAFARFKEATEPARWSVATLPVELFTAQVPGTPSTQEVQKIFAAGQNIEPDPTQNRPALKKPRELKVGWLEVTGKEAYYVSAAAEAMAKIEPAVNLAHLLAAPLAGGPLGQVAGVGVTSVPDKLLLGEYERYKAAEVEKAAAWPAAPRAFEPYKSGATDANLAQPELAARMVGHAAASPLTAGLIAQLRAERQDDAARVAASLPPFAPAPGGLAAAALAAAAADKEIYPKPLPLAAVRGRIAEKVRESFQLSSLPRGDIEQLITDTRKAVADSPNDKTAGRAAAKKILDAFVATRKLADLKQVGGSVGFADMYAVSRDAGLERLLSRFAGAHAFGNLDGFGRAFFRDSSRGAPGQAPKEVESQLFFQPKTYPESAIGDLAKQSQYLVWLTEEVPSAAPRLAGDVKDKIEAEWRRQKARALAKDAAEKLAKKVAELKPDEATLSREWSELAKAYGPLSLMPPLAGMMLRATGDGGYEFEQYRWPETVIKYPTEKMATELRDNRNKPLGTALVHADQPENAYYVFVLVGRGERLPVEYADAVYAPVTTGPKNPAGEQLPGMFARDARKAAIDDALELLRSEFGYADENPNIHKKQQQD